MNTLPNDARLVFTIGKADPVVIHLSEPTTLVGRRHGSEFPQVKEKIKEQESYSVTVNDTKFVGFPSLINLSSHQFTIYRVDESEEPTFWLEDLYSRGGTRLNDEFVRETVRLVNGDVIRSCYQFQFECRI